jgi:hypothetical protein
MSLFEDPTIARVTALILKVLEKAPHRPHSSGTVRMLGRSPGDGAFGFSPRFSS